MLLKTFIVLLAIFFVNCSYGGVYKCKDNLGRVTFSDTACSTKERESIDVDALRGEQLKRSSNIATTSIIGKPSQNKSNKYRCDGRTLCSQMTSCEEATFFLNNCPNTKMDGGRAGERPDGIPCEKQWCGKN